MDLPRILVVDDEAPLLNVIKRMLEEDGWKVSTAESGAAALELLRGSSFQLMLTDIVMGGMDGMELVEKAREACPELDIIVMTSYPTLETSLQSLGFGVVNYLLKPLSRESLQVTVWGWWREWFARKTLEASRATLEECLEGLLQDLGELGKDLPPAAAPKLKAVAERAGTLGGLVGELQTTVQALASKRRPTA